MYVSVYIYIYIYIYSDLYPELFELFLAYVLGVCVTAFYELILHWVQMSFGLSILKMTSDTEACLIELYR
jgi:hypothetical protein